MFREMRRKNQQLSEQQAIEILKSGTSGVLALLGDGGYPYAVPISYVYSDSKLYFHAAKSGHKIDAIKNCDKASFCVVAEDDVVPEKYTTLFRSAVAFGRIRIIESESEMKIAISNLAIKYHPTGSGQSREHEIKGAWNRLCIFELTIEHLTGKQSIELV